MLRLTLFVIFMAMTMKLYAQDTNSTTNQQHNALSSNLQLAEFFRPWLLDDLGKDVVKKLLQENLSFDERTSETTISYMVKTFVVIDERAKALYEKQQQLFVSQYNQGKSKQHHIDKFRPELFDQKDLMAAEDTIQAKLAEVLDEHISGLRRLIGESSFVNLSDLVAEVKRHSSDFTPQELEQMEKEIAQPLNYVIKDNKKKPTQSDGQFNVIKKEF